MFKVVSRWIGNTFLLLLATLFLSSILLSYQSHKHPGQIPSIFGYKIMTVLSGSMRPMLQPGDIVIDRDPDLAKFKVDQIITYKREDKFITHRVIDLVKKNGVVYYKTKGDANNVEDNKLVAPQQVVGDYAFHIPNAGFFLEFARGKLGILLFIILPAILIVLSEVFKDKRPKKKGRKDRPYPQEDIV
ncbi:signal peptidase I [Fictibacillus sp. FJAT-27399]|uniref:signal peptidase I n=1 Tax=Fictibacillus sp. FJAT-27399 TaxID=1729689 RepID=UPI0007811ACB|nr:signal peptidase I [Fictibacillus sp. FJAT-27399]